MQIKVKQEIGIGKSFGSTHPGQTILNLTLEPNSLQFSKNVSHLHTNFTKFATKIPSSSVIDACLI